MVTVMELRNINIYEYQLCGARLEEDGKGVSNACYAVRKCDEDDVVLPYG
jgi:hypothetical protein